MSEIMVFAERDDLAFELLTRGRDLAGRLGAVLSATLPGTKDGRVQGYFAHGATRVYACNCEWGPDPATWAQALARIVTAHDVRIVLAASTRRGKAMAPRLAQMLSAGCVTDAFDIEATGTDVIASRYGLGGITVTSERIVTPRQVVALLPRSFAAESLPDRPAGGEIVEIDVRLGPPRVQVIKREPKTRESVDLEKAHTLVCIGRGLKKKEDLSLIRELTATVNGEVACTQSLASDLGWLSEDRIVGTSGKRCKPRTAFSIGVSGQSQHMAGIAGARTVVAINSDPAAPIFKGSDYGLVADLYQAVPALIKRLRAEKKST